MEFWDDTPGFTRIYENDNGDTIFFQYMFGNPGMALYVSDVPDPVNIFVGPYPADFYPATEPGEQNILVWTDTERDILFSVGAPLPQEDLIQFAENIVIK